MYIYANINKDTLRFVREKKAISFDYIERITKFPKAKISSWEQLSSDKFPTINQAKALAKCFRIPFAGLYMNANDIDVKHLPQMRNYRTLPGSSVDNSALNLAILDVMSARDLLIESKIALKEELAQFNLSISTTLENVDQWAQEIRRGLQINSDIQYKCQSTRQFYLYVRDKVETAGVFVHCFTGVDTEVMRGFAIYDEVMPVIGLNSEDRYPAKTFSIIHELVHLLKRSSAVCNEMFSSFTEQAEEVFCNAVAGEVLVPKENLMKLIGNYTANEIDHDMIETLATKFSVSKEVICRRLLDSGRLTKSQYDTTTDVIRLKFEEDRESAKELRRQTGQGIPRNISREAVDQTSTALCRTFYHGYREGFFEKQDISRYLGIKQSHIDRFIAEVSRW